MIHYSLSREEHIGDWDPNEKPDLANLTSVGFTKTQLRAHSDYYWNQASNSWAYSFSKTHDIMLETKMKNLAHRDFCQSMNH